MTREEPLGPKDSREGGQGYSSGRIHGLQNKTHKCPAAGSMMAIWQFKPGAKEDQGIWTRGATPNTRLKRKQESERLLGDGKVLELV